MNNECREADEYVRDHLLIDFICRKLNVNLQVKYEELYEAWIDWLKTMEAKNDKGSKI